VMVVGRKIEFKLATNEQRALYREFVLTYLR
jgi:hypothetical protein